MGPGLFLILTTVVTSADQASPDTADTGATGDDQRVQLRWIDALE